jgi:hypothetical protein
MTALASNKGSMIFASAIEIKKKMPDLNFKLFPSGIKPFVPTRGTVEDISSLFGSLQEMKIPQVQSDIDFEVVNSYTTDLPVGTNGLIPEGNSLKFKSGIFFLISIALAKIILPLFEAKAVITSSFLVLRFSSDWLVCPLRSDSCVFTVFRSNSAWFCKFLEYLVMSSIKFCSFCFICSIVSSTKESHLVSKSWISLGFV